MSKILLLPKNHTSYHVLSMPIPRDPSKSKPYLVCDGDVYELNEITKTSWSNAPETKSGDFVRSIIVEGDKGSILQSAHMVVSSKFNLAYLFISLMGSGFSQMFASLEDIADKIGAEWIHKLDENTVAKSLELVCDVQKAGDEPFYRFSEPKAVAFVKERISRLALHMQTNKTTLYMKAKHSVEDHMVDLAVKSTAVDFVCGSYTPSLRQQLEKEYDFSALEAHKAKLKQEAKSRSFVEENMADLGKKKTTVKKKAPVKKKVAVGRGALDGFFKRA